MITSDLFSKESKKPRGTNRELNFGDSSAALALPHLPPDIFFGRITPSRCFFSRTPGAVSRGFCSITGNVGGLSSPGKCNRDFDKMVDMMVGFEQVTHLRNVVILGIYETKSRVYKI